MNPRLHYKFILFFNQNSRESVSQLALLCFKQPGPEAANLRNLIAK